MRFSISRWKGGELEVDAEKIVLVSLFPSEIEKEWLRESRFFLFGDPSVGGVVPTGFIWIVTVMYWKVRRRLTVLAVDCETVECQRSMFLTFLLKPV